MSLGDGGKAELRALAHPVRLRIMSLLSEASLTAAEVARELDITHANASYHLRNLHSGGLVTVAGVEKIRGGVAKRYRSGAANDSGAWCSALATELRRRAAEGRWPGIGLLDDAEVWIDPDTWQEIRDRMAAAVRDLHEAARPPRTPGTLRTSTTVALFEMDPR
ncbi:helix-turn-helix domain-containing protein [Actinoplanes aureus]|uniref:Helix-turn-helix domain-containing protein n=1 Tax=Actinoplanes aureus TaxID=2792083 RepID=A0A931C3K0_9ACTN|nr:helix-turn-helix domain-containing protein [Actinoplanes aureus]MBG0560451.1 helix-turn-helix domain-containing protein [Actinoplanes aureus]